MLDRPEARVARGVETLQLLALGRIPRCQGCPRYLALVGAQSAQGPRLALPAAPAHCRHRVCAPLAARYRGRGAPLSGEGVLRVIGATTRS